MNVEIGRQNIIINSALEITRPHSFISGNTYSNSEPDIFIGLDSHRPSFSVWWEDPPQQYIVFSMGLIV